MIVPMMKKDENGINIKLKFKLRAAKMIILRHLVGQLIYFSEGMLILNKLIYKNEIKEDE